MREIRNVLLGCSLAIASAFASATVVNVQGVEWDTASVDDFESTASLRQWFQAGPAYDPLGSVIAFNGNPLQLVGSYVTGAGLISSINGVNAPIFLPPASFPPARELTYTYGGILITGVDLTNPLAPLYSFDLTASYFNVYSDTSLDFFNSGGTTLAHQVGAGNTNFATPFLTGEFDEFTVASTLLTAGGNLAGSANGLISVTGGAAFAFFDTNGEQSVKDPTLFADLSFTGSSQLAVGNSISTVGTGEFTGSTQFVPEPGTLALVGLSLIGLGLARRRA